MRSVIIDLTTRAVGFVSGRNPRYTGGMRQEKNRVGNYEIAWQVFCTKRLQAVVTRVLKEPFQVDGQIPLTFDQML